MKVEDDFIAVGNWKANSSMKLETIYKTFPKLPFKYNTTMENMNLTIFNNLHQPNEKHNHPCVDSSLNLSSYAEVKSDYSLSSDDEDGELPVKPSLNPTSPPSKLSPLEVILKVQYRVLFFLRNMKFSFSKK